MLSARNNKSLSNSAENLENKYTVTQKQKILQIVNEGDLETLSRYDVAKTRIKKLTEWVNKYGKLNTISQLETVDGFTEKTVKKFCTSIINGVPKNLSNRIKGQILHPALSDIVRQSCRSVLSVYVTINSVCWTLIDRANYEVLEWKYHGIDYPEGKRFQITDILDIAWNITKNLPNADLYVMKAEATSLRASGSDPNNPKMLTVNLQKAQLIAMMVTLINTRSNDVNVSSSEDNAEPFKLNQKVYFLRPTLPYRLHGTLVGNERVSTDQTVEMLLQEARASRWDNSHAHVPDRLATMFRSQKDLQKDMLGHCLLLALTFMDLCIYVNPESIKRLTCRGN
ncbi:unnamed protein product, partial [Iphiclides podalirius]